MILVDWKGGPEGQKIPKQFVEDIKKIGVPAQISDLEYGDFAFEGNGPEGPIGVGIERKTLHDMLSCIQDARFGGHQWIGMKQLYGIRILMLEGHWKPHDPGGTLMEGFNGGMSWGFCKFRSQRTMYSMLYRYLCSLQLGGVLISYSRDPWHTAYNVCEWYHHLQKRWDAHQSLKEIHKVAIPSLSVHPSLVRKWAHAIDGVGTGLSEYADRLFKKPIDLAQSDESHWLRIPGIGIGTAKDIMRQIWGLKK